MDGVDFAMAVQIHVIRTAVHNKVPGLQLLDEHNESAICKDNLETRESWWT